MPTLFYLSGKDKTYLSYYTPYSHNIVDDAVDDAHTPNFQNTIATSQYFQISSWD